MTAVSVNGRKLPKRTSMLGVWAEKFFHLLFFLSSHATAEILGCNTNCRNLSVCAQEQRAIGAQEVWEREK